MKFTWQKVFAFLGIIALGIIGLIIADQYDFLGGRTDESINIGTGSVEKIDQPFQLKKTEQLPDNTTVKRPLDGKRSNI
jgi:hypothetical protein